jgi:hypothetical protein
MKTSDEQQRKQRKKLKKVTRFAKEENETKKELSILAFDCRPQNKLHFQS